MFLDYILGELVFELKFYLCPDQNLVNKLKILYFYKHFVLFLGDHFRF